LKNNKSLIKNEFINRTVHKRDKTFTWVQNPISNNHAFFWRIKQLSIIMPKATGFQTTKPSNESCCRGRDRSKQLQNRQRIRDEYCSVRCKIFRKSPASRSSGWTLDVVNTKRRAVAGICRVFWIQSNFSEVVSFSREVVVLKVCSFEQKYYILASRFLIDRVTMFAKRVRTAASDWSVSDVAKASQNNRFFLSSLEVSR